MPLSYPHIQTTSNNNLNNYLNTSSYNQSNNMSSRNNYNSLKNITRPTTSSTRRYSRSMSTYRYTSN